MRVGLAVIALLLAGPAARGQAPAPADAGPSLAAVWNNGLFFETPAKDFTAHVGGVVHFDTAYYTAPPALETFPGGTGPFNDGAHLRRGRLFAEGSLYAEYDYKFELEFFNGVAASAAGSPVRVGDVSNSVGPTDAWLQVKNVPVVGNVRVGSQKEPFSLEHLESFRYLTFLERSYLFDVSQPTAFNNGFSLGVSAFDTSPDERLFGQVGVFKNSGSPFGFAVGDGEYAATGRVAVLPIYVPAERRFWHVGGALSHRDPVGDRVQLRARSSVRGAPVPLLTVIADTGPLVADSSGHFNLETAAVAGPLSVQGEYTANVVNNASPAAAGPRGDLVFPGYYAQATYLLTGESRTWNPKSATYNRIVPRRNFAPRGGGLGAVEVAGRFSHFDGSDGPVRGGRLNSVTLGLNWYLNPNMKLQFNYDYTYRDGVANPLARGSIHAFGTRAAFDF